MERIPQETPRVEDPRDTFEDLLRPRLVTRSEAGSILGGVPTATLARWAYRGDGPPYYRVGRHALYREDELWRWLETRRIDHSSTPQQSGQAQ
jgi:hypothetical protein